SIPSPASWDTSCKSRVPPVPQFPHLERGPPCPAECPRERHRPVCASDGKLYKSHCVFQRARCQEPLLEAAVGMWDPAAPPPPHGPL
uniref:Kazal-like domain-containing protein n=1 Tax=Chelydra serpentina TaxID=8475 RepID=A0A8C3SD46_CHESE